MRGIVKPYMKLSELGRTHLAGLEELRRMANRREAACPVASSASALRLPAEGRCARLCGDESE